MALAAALSVSPAQAVFAEGDSLSARALVRSRAYAFALEACIESGLELADLPCFADFLRAVRCVTLDPGRASGAKPCTWSSFKVLASSPDPSAPADPLERSVRLFALAAWLPPSAAATMHGLSTTSTSAPVSSMRSTPPGPALGQVIGFPGTGSIINMAEESDDEDEERACVEAGDALGPGARTPLGELTPKYASKYADFLLKLRADQELAPCPAEGVTSWAAAQSFALLASLASDTVGHALTVDLNAIYGGDYASARFSPAATLPRETHASVLRAATAGRSVLLGCNSSAVVNVIRRLVATGAQHLGIGVAGDGSIYPDVRRLSTAPDHTSGGHSWWAEHIDKMVPVLIALALRQRQPPPTAAPPTHVLPDVVLSPFIGDAICRTFMALADRYPDTPRQWLFYFLLCELVFLGRVHLCLHADLERRLERLSGAIATAGGLAQCPNYVNYLLVKDLVGVPDAWIPACRTAVAPAASTPTNPRTTAAVTPLPQNPVVPAVAAPAAATRKRPTPSHGDRSAAGRHGGRATPFAKSAPLSLPWAVVHPDEKRVAGLCAYCGPTGKHELAECARYTAFITGGGEKLPAFSNFGLGKSLNEALGK